MLILINWNFGFLRYVVLTMPHGFKHDVLEGLIWQWPWWSLEKALMAGKFHEFSRK